MKTNKAVKVVAASVAGPQHNQKKMPCQDCCMYDKQGRNFVAVVSDGAGSAKYGRIGARILCQSLIDLLKNAPTAKLADRVYQAVETARRKLVLHRFNRGKKEDGISQFAATLVGVVFCRGEGMFFHIGDGAAVAFDSADLTHFVASPPENGTFSCETFFYTQSDWRDYLRLTRFSGLDTVLLMSDGLTNFAFSNDFQQIEKGFVQPIDEFLTAQKVTGRAQAALTNTLNNARARRLNSDDKTLLWAKFER